MRSGFAPQPYYTIRPVLTIPMDQGEPCYWTRSSFHRKMVPAHPPRSRPHPSSPAHPEYSTRPVSKRDVFLVMVAALEPLASAGRLRSGMPHHDAKAVAALVHGLVGEFIDEGLGNTSRARSLEFRRRSDDPAGTEHPIPRHHQGIAEETPTTGAESESPPACRPGGSSASITPLSSHDFRQFPAASPANVWLRYRSRMCVVGCVMAGGRPSDIPAYRRRCSFTRSRCRFRAPATRPARPRSRPIGDRPAGRS
jgi:hypothetical protein